MTDFSKIKRGRLSAPPTLEEASPNLEAPEHAPASQITATPQRTDGRKLRASGRTVQFATRVTPEFHERIRAIAVRDNLKLVEILELALDAYETIEAR